MRILCSNEQGKLCFRQTKTVLSDRNCALQRSAETLLRSRNSRRKEVQIQNQTDRENKCDKNGQEIQECPCRLKYSLRLNVEKTADSRNCWRNPVQRTAHFSSRRLFGWSLTRSRYYIRLTEFYRQS